MTKRVMQNRRQRFQNILTWDATSPFGAVSVYIKMDMSTKDQRSVWISVTKDLGIITIIKTN